MYSDCCIMCAFCASAHQMYARFAFPQYARTSLERRPCCWRSSVLRIVFSFASICTGDRRTGRRCGATWRAFASAAATSPSHYFSSGDCSLQVHKTNAMHMIRPVPLRPRSSELAGAPRPGRPSAAPPRPLPWPCCTSRPDRLSAITISHATEISEHCNCSQRCRR